MLARTSLTSDGLKERQDDVGRASEGIEFAPLKQDGALICRTLGE